MRGNPTFIETPSTTGLNYKYVFNKNGSIDYYENNVLRATNQYVIDYERNWKASTLDSDACNSRLAMLADSYKILAPQQAVNGSCKFKYTIRKQ
jgi:hypothetical protein